MKFITLVFIAFFLSSLVLTKGKEENASCILEDLQICKTAVTTGKPPSTECCDKLKEQQTCFCDYLKDPRVSHYISAAKQILAACGIPFPSCN
ncbi:Bifunctional inhibitor/plant lipid transfer protein/seed storage helical domain [Arabidopsis thaliana x Arabidopsis arenosa]|uniref:Bifunctional inhibitor/plant lipid transfer protein/seed storage helical domain n=2 Tax=Arabidopsis TaxID=3701 RepID=A0A8T1YNT3_ARASU|nr:Bifunctional inhibitor/plant lipid transfer protein/seed storage helical domain [Arabidopsis thaliana x Arabidopsis arenosa]KAG7547923.1 Bifunctional inhibitor/plant lipid transfer protein/seed storage helical domain [Arabidopsis suecica]